MPPEHCLGRDLGDVLVSLPQATLAALRHSFTDPELPPDVELTEDGTHWLASFFAVRSDDGAVVGLGSLMNDITERKRLEESLAHRATHDVLTGLPKSEAVRGAGGGCGEPLAARRLHHRRAVRRP